MSTAYKIAKQSKPILSSIDTPQKVSFDNNVLISEGSTMALSLKMDETYIKPNLAYSSRDKVYGICYQHGSHHKLSNKIPLVITSL